MSSVKRGERSVPPCPSGCTEGAFVRRHLAPITARQNSFSAVGRRVNGPRVGCEEQPCPHTPTRGQGLIGTLLMWRMRFRQPFAGEGEPEQSWENVIQLGGQLAVHSVRVLRTDGQQNPGQTGAKEGHIPAHQERGHR